MNAIDEKVKLHLTLGLDEVGAHFGANAVAVFGPIVQGIDALLRHAVEAFPGKKDSIVVVLDTPGGVVEVVERMVAALRHAHQNVIVLVPDRAMSAGTVLALSADHIFMDYFSCLGPIDPQIERDGKLVPALSFIQQFERLNQKAMEGTLTVAEYALLSKFDPGELHQFEQARELSVELLIKWLPRYKFKDWRRTESQGKEVTADMRKERAKEIADLLSDTERWHSHGRAIDMATLQDEVGLKVDDLAGLPENVIQSIWSYFGLLNDYMQEKKLPMFVHSKGYF